MNKQILIEDTNAFAENFELSESLRGKTFMVTGATGLIGSVMIKCLLTLNRKYALGIKIIAVIRDSDKAKGIFADEFSEIEFKILSLKEITVSAINTEVDYIVHLASPTASKYFVEHPVETLRTAIEGTTAVLEFAKSTQIIGMVYASSLEVYGSNDTDEWIDENFQGYVNPVETRSSYNVGKRAVECLCHSYAKEYSVPVMMARFTQVFGAGISESENRVFAQFARSIIMGTDIEIHTQGLSAKPYCYTTDAVSAMLYIMLKGHPGEAYNIANKDSYISIRNMAFMLRDYFNPQISITICPKENQGYAPQTKLRLSTDKIESLGWKPHYDLHQMFDRLILSMKD
jgi:nucleoside-diphosphate-sugar epimerase